MQKRPTVPQFGNWEGENNLPYTIYFDEARKAKNGGKMMNPNDPMEYPGMFPSSPKATPSTARNAPQEPIGRKGVRPTTVDSQSRENRDMEKFNDGPLSNDNVSYFSTFIVFSVLARNTGVVCFITCFDATFLIA